MDNRVNINAIYMMMLAIANFEGYWISGSRARRNNNPGNLRGWSSRLPKDDAGFDIFPTAEEGWNALWQQIWLNIQRGLTLKQFFEGKPGVYPGYAPLKDNNPPTYAKYVSQISGIPLDSVTIFHFIVK